MTMKNIELIGNNLRILRENAGFNQQSIATFLGVDQSFISKIEKGERAVSAEMLEKLATLFGVNASSILQKETVSKTLSCAFMLFSSESEIESIVYTAKFSLTGSLK